MSQSVQAGRVKGKKQAGTGKAKHGRGQPRRVAEKARSSPAVPVNLVRATCSLPDVTWRMVSGGLVLLAALVLGYFILRQYWGQTYFMAALPLLLIPLAGIAYAVQRWVVAIRERPRALRLSRAGQVMDGTVVKAIEANRRVEMDPKRGGLTWLGSGRPAGSGGGDGKPRATFYYYVTVEFAAGSMKYAIQQEVTHEEFLQIKEGTTLKVRYLPDNPAIARLAES